MAPLVWYQIPGLLDHFEAAVIYFAFAATMAVMLYKWREPDSESFLLRHAKKIGNGLFAVGVIIATSVIWNARSDFQEMQTFVEYAGPISQELEAYSHENDDPVFQSKLLRTAAKIAEVKGEASEDVKIALYQKLYEEIDKADPDLSMLVQDASEAMKLQDIDEFLRVRKSVKECFTHKRYLTTVKYPADWDKVRQELIDTYANQGYLEQVNINCEFLRNRVVTND